MTYTVSIIKVTSISDLKQEWEALEMCSDCSYFLTWRWIGSWLTEVVFNQDFSVMRVADDNVLVAIGIVVKPRFRQKRKYFERMIFLNEAPIPQHDMIIEYNGLLVRQGYEDGIYKTVILYLQSVDKQWDSFKITRIRSALANTFLNAMGNAFYSTITDKTKSWQYVSPAQCFDKEKLIGGLSKNRRHQIRKALLIHEEIGDIAVREASSLDEAKDFFGKLRVFHTARWEAKGGQGSFKNSIWENFHLKLIARGHALGEIQLIEVSTPSTVLGYIYNFVWRNRVYVLQTGFNTALDKKSQPGYVSHIHAILYNHQKGNYVYDLLCEDSGYKKTLCNNSEDVVSVSLKLNTYRSMLRLISPSSLKDGYLVNFLRTKLKF